MEKIDFIILWFDGTDPVWRAEKQKWEALCGIEERKTDDSRSECRYRSDDKMLRYWLRSVEKFAPWVNKVFIISCGQKPDWLDENHPKLRLAYHEDFIPSQYLPTFNSVTIEMNLHRIGELSEHFVHFCDDMFLLRPLGPEFFFRGGDPVLDANLRYTNVVYSNWSRLLFNSYCLVNSSFDMSKSIWENRKKWFNLKELGYKRVRRNFACYLANGTLPVGMYGHIAVPHLKSTLEEVWEQYPEVMHQSSLRKFRSDDQVVQWLLSAWNQAKGRFYPANARRQGANISISPDNVDYACEIIRNQSIPQVCINDSKYNTDPVRSAVEIEKAFEAILPDMSQFELN